MTRPAAVWTRHPVTAETETFDVLLTDWDPYGGAGSFGMLEMDMWAVTLEHSTAAATAAGHPAWVLTLPDDLDLSGHDGRAPVPTRAVRYTGGPLDEYQTAGLLVLVDGTLHASTDLYPFTC